MFCGAAAWRNVQVRISRTSSGFATLPTSRRSVLGVAGPCWSLAARGRGLSFMYRTSMRQHRRTFHPFLHYPKLIRRGLAPRLMYFSDMFVAVVFLNLPLHAVWNFHDSQVAEFTASLFAQFLHNLYESLTVSRDVARI